VVFIIKRFDKKFSFYYNKENVDEETRVFISIFRENGLVAERPFIYFNTLFTLELRF